MRISRAGELSCQSFIGRTATAAVGFFFLKEFLVLIFLPVTIANQIEKFYRNVSTFLEI